MRKLIRLLVLMVGITCLATGGFLFWEQNRPNKYSFSDFKPSTQTGETLPSYLTYNSISLPITTARVNDGRWPLSGESAIYLEGSGVIGEAGNAVIYGHNWESILGFLKDVKPGEIIRVTTSDNLHFDYTVDLVAEVTPDQVHILSPSTDKRLTLYTCSGFLDKKRLVVVARSAF